MKTGLLNYSLAEDQGTPNPLGWSSEIPKIVETLGQVSGSTLVCGVCVCVCVFSSLGDIRRPMTQPSTVWQPGRKDDEPVRKAKRPNIGTTSERH